MTDTNPFMYSAGMGSLTHQLPAVSTFENKEDTKAKVKRRSQRKKLMAIRLFVSKVLLVTSLASILIMITNAQLVLLSVYSVCSETATAMKTAVTALTILTLFSIWLYSYLQLEIFRNLRNINSVWMALQVSPQRVTLLMVETLITIPHPLPVCFGFNIYSSSPRFPSEHEDEALNMGNVSQTTTSSSIQNFTNPALALGNAERIIRLNKWDALLSIMMFARLYQIARFTVLHSKLFRTMLSYSLGALAQTKYNFSFIFKSYMAVYKGYFLGAIALAFVLISAWCIYISDKAITTYQDALWVIGITFFTVGYGDISPVEKISQIIAVLTGFSGMFFMGISVAILSRYLQLTYDEYCMLSFFIDADLQKKRRETSAKIIQAAWWQYKAYSTNSDSITKFKTQQTLIMALHQKKNIESERVTGRERREKQVPLYDMREHMKKLTIRTDHVYKRASNIADSMKVISEKLLTMQEKLSTLIKLLQKEKRKIPAH